MSFFSWISPKVIRTNHRRESKCLEHMEWECAFPWTESAKSFSICLLEKRKWQPSAYWFSSQILRTAPCGSDINQSISMPSGLGMFTLGKPKIRPLKQHRLLGEVCLRLPSISLNLFSHLFNGLLCGNHLPACGQQHVKSRVSSVTPRCHWAASLRRPSSPLLFLCLFGQ